MKKVFFIGIGIILSTQLLRAEKPLTATEQVKQFMETKNWREGWDGDKKRFFAAGKSEFTIENTADATDFAKSRTTHFRIAVLDAKSQIAEYSNMKVKAFESLNVENSGLGEHYSQLKRKINAVGNRLLEEWGEETIPQDWSPSVTHTHILRIYGIQSSITTEQKQLVQKFLKAFSELSELMENENNRSPAVTKEFRSDIETFAQEPVCGAVVLLHSESWNEATGSYQISVLTVWSPTLEQRAEQILAWKIPAAEKKVGKKSIHDYISEQDLSLLTGGRQYLDNKGNRWFLGVGSVPFPDQGSSKNILRAKAELQATSALAFSIYSDIEAWNMASTITRETNSIDGTINRLTLEEFQQRLSQRINKPISGIMTLTEAEVVHPIFKKRMLVVVKGVSAESLADKKPDELSFENEDAPIPSLFEKMVKRGQLSCRESSQSAGEFFIVAGEIPENSANRNEALSLARIAAKKELAAFLNQLIQANESYTAEKNNELYSSFIQSDVKQLLSHAKALDIVSVNGRQYLGYVLTEKLIAPSQNNHNQQEKSAVKNSSGNMRVVAVGMAAIVSERVDQARSQSLAQAKREAVEQALGTAISATTQAKDFEQIAEKIFTNAVGYIDSFTIIDEGAKNGIYSSKIEAVVAKDKLFESYRSMLQSMGDPHFYIDANDDAELQKRFSGLFTELDFKITNQKQEASYVISLEGEFRQLQHPATKSKGMQLSLWVRLIDPTNSEVLFDVKNDPRKAAVFYSNSERQHELVINKAFKQIREPLHEAINTVVVNMVQSGRTVKIRIDGFSQAFAGKIPDFTKLIESAPGVSSVVAKMDAVMMQLDFEVTYSGRTDVLSEFLNPELKNLPFAYRPSIKEMSQNAITYTLE